MYCGCFLILSTIPPHKEVTPPSDRCIYVDKDNEEEIINSLNYVAKEIYKLKDQRGMSKEHSIERFGLCIICIIGIAEIVQLGPILSKN